MPKLSLWRRMQIPFVSAFVYRIIRFIGPTLRLEILGVHNAIQIQRSGQPGIWAFWHRCIFPAVWIWRGRDIFVLNTVNFDGQWTRRVIERLGFGTVQGSSSRGGIEALTGMARKLEEGNHVAFTIDGPRGPRYVAKPGPVILARRTGRPIAVFHVGVEHGLTFKGSWDHFRLPFPRSRVVMFVAPPIYLPADGDSTVMKEKQNEMQAALERVRDAAERWFDLSEKEQDDLREEWSDGMYRGRLEQIAARADLRAYAPATEPEPGEELGTLAETELETERTESEASSERSHLDEESQGASSAETGSAEHSAASNGSKAVCEPDDPLHSDRLESNSSEHDTHE